jgi:PKD repeat protein
MKRITIVLFILFAMISGANTQNSLLAFSGVVIDENGGPVGMHLVNVDIMSAGLMEHYEYYTSPAGFFGDSIPTFGYGTIIVSTLDCNQQPVTLQENFSPGNMSFFFTLSICWNGGGGCQADFMWMYAYCPGCVGFFDQSLGNPVSWIWEFGDGVTSNLQNPEHTYAAPGIYNVTLLITTADSCTSTVMHPVDVWNFPGGCTAFFTASPNPADPLTWNFTDQSQGGPISQWHWDFGDGTFAFDPNPVHTFPQQGVYNVCLTISDSMNTCNDTYCEPVLAGIPGGITLTASGFVMDDINGVPVPDHEVFITVAGGGVIIYTSVVLTDMGGYYMDVFTVPEYMTTGTASILTYDCNQVPHEQMVTWSPNSTNLVADFFICSNPMPGDCDNWFDAVTIDNLTYTFTGYVMNNLPAFYFWDFGDGATAQGQQVVHTYTPVNGMVYTACLTTLVNDPMTGDSCMDVSCQDIFVGGGTGCDNDFTFFTNNGYTFTFEGNIMPPQPVEWLWDFGDGATGYGPLVIHEFQPAPGQNVFQVCLTTFSFDPAIGDSCFDVTCHEVVAGNPGGDCTSWFEYFANGLTVHFTGFTMSPFPTEYQWIFMNGLVLTGQNITYEFPGPGYYTVMLNTYDANGCSYSYTEEIYVEGPGGGNHTLYGQIFMGNFFADYAAVVLFGINAGGTVTFQMVETDTSGTYVFNGVPDGNYIILASLTPQSPGFFSYFPTYYGDAIWWFMATTINLGEPQNPYNVHLVPTGFLTPGAYSISGNIWNGTKAGPVDDAHVLLMDQAGNPLLYQVTDEQGAYAFEGLGAGNYKVKAEIPGLTSETAEVTLSENNPVSTVNFIVNGSSVILGAESKQAVIEKVGEVFPNPLNGDASLIITLKNPAVLRLTVISQYGQTVMERTEASGAGSNTLTFGFGNLAEGVYTLRIQGEDGSGAARKFIKKR